MLNAKDQTVYQIKAVEKLQKYEDDFNLYYLQHERPCCISIYKLGTKARVVNLIQRGREFCK